MDDAPLRIDAIRAIAAFDDESLGKLLIARFQTFNAAEKAEAVQTLASRGRYGRMLTDALASGAIAKRDVPSSCCAAASPRRGRPVCRRVGADRASNAGEDRAYARYRGMLTESAIGRRQPASRARDIPADLRRLPQVVWRGRHDRTGSDRLEPRQPGIPAVERPQSERARSRTPTRWSSSRLATGARTRGNVASETDRQLTLRVVGRDPIAINKADIQAREATAAVDDAAGPVRPAHRSRGHRSGGVPSHPGTSEDSLTMIVFSGIPSCHRVPRVSVVGS